MLNINVDNEFLARGLGEDKGDCGAGAAA